MKESKKMLRLRFQAKTDVEIDPTPSDWQQYAEWLEVLAIKELNNEMLKEHGMLKQKMRQAMDVLEKGIVGTRVKILASRASQKAGRNQHQSNFASFKARIGKKGATTK